jgi:transposase
MAMLLDAPTREKASAQMIGVGIDTARYGHRVTFLRPDLQPAAPPLDVEESPAGYQRLRQALERLARQPNVRFHVRLDAAGQYAANLEQFLRGLPLPLEISVGQPARNAAYRRVHYPKRKSDDTDSRAVARFAVVERPAATPATSTELLMLREVASQLDSQVKQTTRLVNQLHGLMARVFPELATLAPDLGAQWVLRLLEAYPTPQRIARARQASLTAIPYLTGKKAAALQAAARQSVGSLRGPIAETLVCQAVGEIRLSQQIEKRLGQLLVEAYDVLPEGPHRLLTTIPGIGPGTAAVLVAKVVSIDRFATAEQLVSFFGAFPEENTSGYDRRHRPVPPGTMQMSRQGNDLVRRYLWMAAQSAVVHNPAIRALHRRQRARGKRGDVALGHAMRKLLHLAFAIWKSGRPFDPAHHPWEAADGTTGHARASCSVTTSAGDNKTAAGHRQEVILQGKVVTAATCKVEVSAAEVNPPTQPTPAVAVRPSPLRPHVDYAFLRSQITLERVLEHLRLLEGLRGSRQPRGACPIHGSQNPRSRTFSVNLDRDVFQCFDAACGASGNVLDFWTAFHRLPLYEAALHLAQTFGLRLTP